MSHIAGVLDTRLTSETATSIVDRFVSQIHRHAPALTASKAIGASGAALASMQGTSWSHAANNTLVTISGRPHWSDSELNELQTLRGPAQALYEAYFRFGDQLLQKLQGSFTLAILEPTKKRAMLAVDRMGICALAWQQLDEGIVFATRADILGEHPDVDLKPDIQSLFHYFYSEIIPSPETVFQNTRKLLPAEFLVFDNGRIKTDFYWKIPYSETQASLQDQEQELFTLLEQSVARSMDDKASGAFLSGGLDSSTVTGFFSRLSKTPVDVYGIGFDGAPGYDEMEYAQATADHFGAVLHRYSVIPSDVLNAIPKLVSGYDEPFGNVSSIPAYYCAVMARKAGKECLLAGDGGDEIFAGNERYAKQKVFQLYHQLPGILRSGIIDPLAGIEGGIGRFPPMRKLKSYVQQAKHPMPERLETYNFLHRNALQEIFTDDFLRNVDSDLPVKNNRKTYNNSNANNMLKRMLALDMKNTISDNDLRKVSRTCELAGIEVRYPMLDQRLVEFAAQVPSNRLLKGFQLRSFYKRALKDFLAKETLSKRKHGFGLPFGVWLRQDKELGEMTDKGINDFRQRDYLRSSYIDRLLEAHRSKHADYYGVMISRVLMLELWLKAHNF